MEGRFPFRSLRLGDKVPFPLLQVAALKWKPITGSRKQSRLGLLDCITYLEPRAPLQTLLGSFWIFSTP